MGIWYKNTSPQTVVWVANRETPLIDTSGVVKLDNQGNLTLVNGSGKPIWSSNSYVPGTYISLVAQLLDIGNLVIKNGNNETFIWQSFDYPGDTYLPEMKLGKNFITGRETYLTSWRSADDPSAGEYTLRTRIGPYNGISFSGRPNFTPDPVDPTYVIDMVVNQNEMYFTYVSDSNTTTFLVRTMVTPSGKFEISQLKFPNREWIQSISLPVDYCDNYGVCGPYGSCTTATTPYCGCLKGFELKNSSEPSPDNDTTSVCQRRTTLDCGHGEGFLKFSSMKLPDTDNALFSSNTSLLDCEVACKNNCSCTAYANPNMVDLGACYGLAISLMSEYRHSRFHRKKRVVMVVTLSISAVLGLILYDLISMSHFLGGPKQTLNKDYKASNSQMGSVEVPLFSLSRISMATDDFSVDNKLGQGGVGSVYKMRPKISDFGLARMFKEDESEANTKRVVGTLGYISPEYAVNGLYSVKSDIFSFGVLVLEIVSGKKNRGFVHEDHDDNLLGHAWRLYKEGKSLDLVDECLRTSYSACEVLRVVHVGLLCVQQRVEDRPNTQTVVEMLGGEGSLPSPKKPAFFIPESEINSTLVLPLLSSSVNVVTLSQVDGR
ncbi:hypothetical protein L1987_86052 [Smallanthus sonchifolius]|uniref:Uncharacterized protein n=1 Tax=Smallanthus sonchifolius TaxID=185202 RepID=A0ACB8XYZ3_9ASTR|nr:hypothetical protein L1987_86052 [Smallanthus sonchifolius]